MNWRRAFTSNQTTASITFPAVTLKEPSGSGIIDIPVGGLESHDLEILPFGTDTDDQTCLIQVVGWRKCGITWIPVSLALLTCTLGTVSGLATSTDLLAADLLADAIVATKGLAVLPDSPDEQPTRAIINIYGFDKIQFLTGLNSSAVDVNVLYLIQPTMRSEHKV